MTEQSNQPQNPPAGNEHPKVYSINQDKDGSFHLSRRDFLYVSAAIGGTLLLRGICPRFGAKSAPSELLQAGMAPLPKVYIHAAPSIASDIADTLQQNDLVRLISDHPDLGWVEVATRSGQQGWVKRSFVDFSRAIKSSSPDFGPSSSLTPTPTQTHPSLTLSTQLRGGDIDPDKVFAAGEGQACGEVIVNGDFEAGSVSWAEYSTGTIIRNDWPDRHQGSFVAWFGGVSAVEKLTQLFHVPADVKDAQTLGFYIQVITDETGGGAYDTFCLRFLDAAGSPISSDTLIANNTTLTDWRRISVDLSGMRGLADQNIQVQFEAEFDASLYTHFVIDSVSLNLTCGVYVYLPLIVRELPPTPTPTPRPSATPCSSYCSSDCSSDCYSDCSSDCSSDCGYVCVYDCTFDCIYYCAYDW